MLFLVKLTGPRPIPWASTSPFSGQSLGVLYPTHHLRIVSLPDGWFMLMESRDVVSHFPRISSNIACLRWKRQNCFCKQAFLLVYRTFVLFCASKLPFCIVENRKNLESVLVWIEFNACEGKVFSKYQIAGEFIQIHLLFVFVEMDSWCASDGFLIEGM